MRASIGWNYKALKPCLYEHYNTLCLRTIWTYKVSANKGLSRNRLPALSGIQFVHLVFLCSFFTLVRRLFTTILFIFFYHTIYPRQIVETIHSITRYFNRQLPLNLIPAKPIVPARYATAMAALPFIQVLLDPEYKPFLHHALFPFLMSFVSSNHFISLVSFGLGK